MTRHTIITCSCCGMPRTPSICHYCVLFTRTGRTQMGPGPNRVKESTR